MITSEQPLWDEFQISLKEWISNDESLELVYKRLSFHHVEPVWIMDCISNFEIQDFNEDIVTMK